MKLSKIKNWGIRADEITKQISFMQFWALLGSDLVLHEVRDKYDSFLYYQCDSDDAFEQFGKWKDCIEQDCLYNHDVSDPLTLMLEG